MNDIIQAYRLFPWFNVAFFDQLSFFVERNVGCNHLASDKFLIFYQLPFKCKIPWRYWLFYMPANNPKKVMHVFVAGRSIIGGAKDKEFICATESVE